MTKPDLSLSTDNKPDVPHRNGIAFLAEYLSHPSNRRKPRQYAGKVFERNIRNHIRSWTPLWRQPPGPPPPPSFVPGGKRHGFAQKPRPFATDLARQRSDITGLLVNREPLRGSEMIAPCKANLGLFIADSLQLLPRFLPSTRSGQCHDGFDIGDTIHAIHPKDWILIPSPPGSFTQRTE